MQEKKSKKSIYSRIRNYFITGVLVLIPIGITVYLTIFLIKISSKLIPQAINPDRFLPYEIPGLEILSVLSNTQVIAAHFFGLCFSLWLLRSIYK